jgi:hypothetical protein
MRVADKFPIAGVFPIGRRHCVVCKLQVVTAQPKIAVSECTVGKSIGRVSIVLYRVEQVDVEEFQRSSAQGYIIVRDIVTVGVCDGRCGGWCGCFVRWCRVCLFTAGTGRRL